MATYVPQLNEYSPDNIHTDYRYITHKGNYYNMPNCVRYAYGRWWCITGVEPTGLLWLGNGEDWFGNCTAYPKAQAGTSGCVPKLGAIACFADGPYSGLGHVSVVEKIYSDGAVLFSNSAWGGDWFYLKCGYPSDDYHGFKAHGYYCYESAYRFQGFIYLPDSYDPPDPDPDPPDPGPDPRPPRPPRPFGLNKPLWFYCKRRPF